MNKGFQLDREYSVVEVIRYNLRKWWLMVICAALCAAVLGGYKFTSLRQYVNNTEKESVDIVRSSLYVHKYMDADSYDLTADMIRMAISHRTYESFIENTGYEMEYEDYRKLFEADRIDEYTSVVVLDVEYPNSAGYFAVWDEEDAADFSQALLDVITQTSKEVTGKNCVTTLDDPYATKIQKELIAYHINEEDYKKAILKAIAAGIVLGVIAEIVLYTFWLLVYKKPKDSEELREILDVPVIDELKAEMANEEAFKKVALFLGKDHEAAEDAKVCRRVNCITVQCQQKDVALKLAMSYANEQKKTLFVDLASGKEGEEAENSISRYILGQAEMPSPSSLNNYLDTVCRNSGVEKGFNIVMNDRFAAYLDEKSAEYEYIVVNSPDAAQNADGYAAAKLCDKSFLVCGKKTVTNENLYRVKNTVDVNAIQLEGVLVYER